METINKTMVAEELDKRKNDVEKMKFLASIAGLDDESHVSILGAIDKLKINRDRGMFPWLRKIAIVEMALDFLWFDPQFLSRIDLNSYETMYFNSVSNDILREFVSKHGLGVDVNVNKKSLRETVSDILDEMKRRDKDLSKKLDALRAGIKVKKFESEKPAENATQTDSEIDEKDEKLMDDQMYNETIQKLDGETVSVIQSSPIHPVARKTLVLLDLNHIFTYTYSENLPFSIETFMSFIVGMIKMDNNLVHVNDMTGHIFCSGHLFHLKRELKVYASKTMEKDIVDFCNAFKWTSVNGKKIERGSTKNQDVDTYMAVTGAEEILSNKFEVESLYLISGDKDMIPIVDLARRKNVRITVVSYKKMMSRDLSCLADNVIFID